MKELCDLLSMSSVGAPLAKSVHPYALERNIFLVKSQPILKPHMLPELDRLTLFSLLFVMYGLVLLKFLIDALISECTVLLKKRNCFNIIKNDITSKHLIATESKVHSLKIIP